MVDFHQKSSSIKSQLSSKIAFHQIVVFHQNAMTMKLTGTGGQTERRTDKEDHVLSQADALTKNSAWEEPATYICTF